MGLAAKLREAARTGNLSALEGSVEFNDSAESSLEKTIEEARRWIWSGPQPRAEDIVEPRISLPFFKPLEDFERFLDELDRKLMEVLP